MNEEPNQLEFYFKVLKRHALVLAVFFLIPLLIGAVFAAMQKPEFSSSITILVAKKDAPTYLNYNVKDALSSKEVWLKAIDNLSTTYDRNELSKSSLYVKTNKDNSINVTVSNPSKEIPMPLLTKVIENYKIKTDYSQVDDANQSLAQIEEQVRTVELILKNDYLEYNKLKQTSDLFKKAAELKQDIMITERKKNNALSGLSTEETEIKLRELDDTLALQKTELEIMKFEPEMQEINIIETRIETNKKKLEDLNKKRDTSFEKTLYLDIAPTKFVNVLQDATEPYEDRSNAGRTFQSGIFVSIILCSVLFFYFSKFNGKVEESEDLEKILSVPTLAKIPKIDHKTMNSLKENKEYSKSAVVEAYNALRTNLKFITKDAKTIAFVSPMAGAGKTSTVSNLSKVMSYAGDKVLVIDVDLRRSNLHKMFNIPRAPGLTDVLQGEAILKDAMHKVGENLYILPAGSEVDNPIKILSSEIMSKMVDMFRRNYDYVIFDSVPVLAVSDSEITASKADATVMVINAKKNRAPEIKDAKKYLDMSRAKLIGSVLNNVDLRKDTYYYSYYK
jgi:capsular exopolysaccharide synthesis family protein